jgi:uncharacterized protein with GYD domain
MAKYLVQGSYTLDGIRGMAKDGGTKRRGIVQQAIESVGGKLEAFYFMFGKNDVFVIAEAPDNVSVAALSLAISASGSFRGQTTVLLTPEEMDQAAKKAVTYRPPGQ